MNALWNGPRWMDESVTSPANRSPTKMPKPYPLPRCRSRSRMPQRAAKLGLSSDGTGAPLGRGSQRSSQAPHRVRTSCHSSKSLSVSGRSMTRCPWSCSGG